MAISFEVTTANGGFIVYVKRFNNKTKRLTEPVGDPIVVTTPRDLCRLFASVHSKPKLLARLNAIDEADLIEPTGG